MFLEFYLRIWGSSFQKSIFLSLGSSSISSFVTKPKFCTRLIYQSYFLEASSARFRLNFKLLSHLFSFVGSKDISLRLRLFLDWQNTKDLCITTTGSVSQAKWLNLFLQDSKYAYNSLYVFSFSLFKSSSNFNTILLISSSIWNLSVFKWFYIDWKCCAFSFCQLSRVQFCCYDKIDLQSLYILGFQFAIVLARFQRYFSILSNSYSCPQCCYLIFEFIHSSHNKGDLSQVGFGQAWVILLLQCNGQRKFRRVTKEFSNIFYYLPFCIVILINSLLSFLNSNRLDQIFYFTCFINQKLNTKQLQDLNNTFK